MTPRMTRLLIVLPLLSLLPAVCVSRAPLHQLATAPGQVPNLSSRSPNDIWRNCSGGPNPLHIDSISIFPDPPKRGEHVSVVVKLRLEEEVKNGSLNVVMKYGIVPFVNQTWSLCDFAKTQQRHCPLKTGPFEVHFNTTVPTSWLKGRYSGHAVAMDQDGRELLCVQVDLQI